jgi:hypothetical protein
MSRAPSFATRTRCRAMSLGRRERDTRLKTTAMKHLDALRVCEFAAGISTSLDDLCRISKAHTLNSTATVLAPQQRVNLSTLSFLSSM